ncbi:hypothetical protein SLS56_001418, partial [Neofusicoccum ribis]
MLEFPTHRHPRVSVDIQLGAPLFVGGGSLEGNVCITIEDAERQRHKRALAIARISVDLLGVEEMWNAKRDIFMNLATELIDSENPPPENMVDSVKQLSPLDPYWLLNPSVTTMPFSISLPLDVGPPPFQSKLARIRKYQCSPSTIICKTAASTMEKSAGQARIFDNNERTVFAKSSIKQGMHGWSGVAAHTTVTRTCDLELPRGHATVKCGKFFEVRYFLNIVVSSTH